MSTERISVESGAYEASDAGRSSTAHAPRLEMVGAAFTESGNTEWCAHCPCGWAVQRAFGSWAQESADLHVASTDHASSQACVCSANGSPFPHQHATLCPGFSATAKPDSSAARP